MTVTSGAVRAKERVFENFLGATVNCNVRVLGLTRIILVSLCVTDLADTSMFRQEGVTTYSRLLFDVARQQVVVGARYVFQSQTCLRSL